MKKHISTIGQTLKVTPAINAGTPVVITALTIPGQGALDPNINLSVKLRVDKDKYVELASHTGAVINIEVQSATTIQIEASSDSVFELTYAPRYGEVYQ